MNVVATPRRARLGAALLLAAASMTALISTAAPARADLPNTPCPRGADGYWRCPNGSYGYVDGRNHFIWKSATGRVIQDVPVYGLQ